MGKIRFNVIKKESEVSTEELKYKVSPDGSVDKVVDNVDKSATSPLPHPVEKLDGVLKNQVDEKPKRRRGRPPKSANKQIVPLDVAPPVDGIEKTESNDSTDTGKKRGRKKKSESMSVEGLTNQIFGFHQMLNVFIPGTAIGEKQAGLLATNLINVKEAYDIQISEKVTSLLGLAAAVTIVEIPVMNKVRYTMLEKRRKAKVIADAKKEQGKLITMAQPNEINSPVPTQASTTDKTIMNEVGETYAVG